MLSYPTVCEVIILSTSALLIVFPCNALIVSCHYPIVNAAAAIFKANAPSDVYSESLDLVAAQMHHFLLALATHFCGSLAQTIVITTQIVTAPSSTPTSSPQYTSDADFQSAILNSTNFFRTEHNATAVTWNASLANYASNYVNNCQFQHSVCITMRRYAIRIL